MNHLRQVSHNNITDHRRAVRFHNVYEWSEKVRLELEDGEFVFLNKFDS